MMNKLSQVIVIVAAATLGMTSAVQAQDRGQRDGRQWDAPSSGHSDRADHSGRGKRDDAPRSADRHVDRKPTGQHHQARDNNQHGKLAHRGRGDQHRVDRRQSRHGSNGHYSPYERKAFKHTYRHPSKRVDRVKHKSRNGYRGHDYRHDRGRHNSRWHRASHTEIHHHLYQPQTVVLADDAASSTYSGGVELEFDDVRVSWNVTGPL